MASYRTTIEAKKIVPVGKETDRHWEQGEDPSMIDSDIFVYEKRTKLVSPKFRSGKGWLPSVLGG